MALSAGFVFAALLLAFPAARAQQSSAAASRWQRGERQKTLQKPTAATNATACKARARRKPAPRASALRSFLSKDSRVTSESPAIQMPPYTSKAVPEQDLADIYAYLKSIPMPPKGKDIPSAQQIIDRVIALPFCSSSMDRKTSRKPGAAYVQKIAPDQE